MNGSRLRTMAFSLPLALAAALLLLLINEVGYVGSRTAVTELGRSQTTRKTLDLLLQNMLNAETGQRGYLLTNNEHYLQPYHQAVATIHANLETLRQTYELKPRQRDEFALLEHEVENKLSELDLTLKLRQQNNDDAWRFVLSTDAGNNSMDSIRAVTSRLVAHNEQQAQGNARRIERSLRLSRIGIAAVALIGLLAFYMYLRQTRALQTINAHEQQTLARERDRLEQLVRERTASLSQLANHLQQVREDERAHLARELHDELGALLTAAKLDLARLKSRVDMQQSDNAERIQHLTDALNSGIALKRRIIESLRPSSLTNLGLTAALEILARDFAQHSNLQVDTSLEEVALSDAAQLTVYRLVQESLTNIGKYANARKVLVCVHQRPDHVSVQVCDDGIGFDTQRIALDAHGLLGMRHRVEAAGGQLTVHSTPGEGTQIRAMLPQQVTG